MEDAGALVQLLQEQTILELQLGTEVLHLRRVGGERVAKALDQTQLDRDVMLHRANVLGLRVLTLPYLTQNTAGQPLLTGVVPLHLGLLRIYHLVKEDKKCV